MAGRIPRCLQFLAESRLQAQSLEFWCFPARILNRYMQFRAARQVSIA
jgi:hypothetical protein